MTAPTKTISVRIPKDLLEEASRLRPDTQVTAMVTEAFVNWLADQKRQREDELIRSSLAAIKDKQIEEEQALVIRSGHSARKSLGKENG